MLIYNHNKQLVGIDDETLAHLGYKTLAEFQQYHSDVAQLFVKKPGYIHNFQNFPWIDFVLHAEAEDAKVIIDTEEKQFSCNINITPIFLNDAPEREGYVVHFKHIKYLSGEAAAFEREPFPAPEPAAPAAPAPVAEPEPDTSFLYEPEEEPSVLYEDNDFDMHEVPALDLPDLNPDGSIGEPDTVYEEPFEEDTFEFETPEPEPASAKVDKPMLGDYINQEEQAFLDNLQTPADYVYDPHVAADELGLPVELIEEFIGDFIQQAHDFRDDLFDAALREDFDEVHVLSHKLKGVAANLRIEDAFEVLSIINTSRDHVEIEANLKHFYRLVAKMEGKEAPDFADLEQTTAAPATAPAADTGTETAAKTTENEDDIYDFGSLLNDGTKAEENVTLKESPYEMPDISDEIPEIPETSASEEHAAVEEDDAIYDMPDLSFDMPETDAEQEPAPAEETLPPEPEPEIEPFDRDIIPPEEQHLIEDAAEEKGYRQMSGNIATDADLVSEPDFEPLHYDIKKAAAEIGLQEGFIRTLLDEFIQDAETKKPVLMEAIAGADMKKIKAIAFEFKGLSDNLRLLQVSDTLTKLLRNESPAAVKTEAQRFYALLNQL